MINENQNQAMSVLSCSVSGMNICSDASVGNSAQNLIYSGSTSIGTSAGTSTGINAIYYTDSNGTLWNYWQNQYYPYVIRESYPIYIQEKAMDKGKQAFELLKALMDKGLVKVDKVKDFIEAMDTILKTL
jgi:hypothetical protein